LKNATFQTTAKIKIKSPFILQSLPYSVYKMRRQSTIIPPQLRSIIQSESKAKNINACLENIEKAKENELKAYLSLCHARLDLPSTPSDSTSRPQASGPPT